MLGTALGFGQQKAMLYERWRQIARERAAETALRGFPSDRR
jgi:hypothetical protein